MAVLQFVSVCRVRAFCAGTDYGTRTDRKNVWIKTENFEEMHILWSYIWEILMYFKRKVYNELLEWKKTYSDKYAVLLEGARRVGKSTIAENFAQNEYKSYI